MSAQIMDLTASRIAEHAEEHDLAQVDIVLHGGEPLLAGPAKIKYAVKSIRSALGNGRRANFSVQTNGVLLDKDFLELFASLDVHVGISLDGGREAHDKHRRTPGGAGTYEDVSAAIASLADYPGLFSGILSVVDLRNDPVSVYEELIRHQPPVIDFLLPHGNWSHPPPGQGTGNAPPRYGAWLVKAFDRWYQAPRRETRVRLFEEIINVMLGGSSTVEEIGTSPVTVVVVESDGGIERSDMLTTAYSGAGATGLSVAADSFDAVLRSPEVIARQAGLPALAPQCQRCPQGRVCGGGLYAHRYLAGRGFDHPSVYCRDLYRIITHIRARVTDDLRPLSHGDP
jgi:uncharacterized protein